MNATSAGQPGNVPNAICDTTTETTMTINDIAERFTHETTTRTYTHGDTVKTVRGHEMTILHDDGLYRHLRFRSPDTSKMWFDLITWPGCLTVRGDLGDGFTFARLRDMFEFFRGKRIHPDYWSEKLDGGRDRIMQYSPDVFRAAVWDAVRSANAGEHMPGLAKAVQAHFFADDAEWDVDYHESAREALNAFEYFTPAQLDTPFTKLEAWDKTEPFRFGDAWEWDLRDYDWTFLWACHAIVWGIAQYDAAKVSVPTVETVPVSATAGV